MSARRLWDELLAGGWPLLEKWKAERQPETLHLDFKRANFIGSKIHDDDLKNLSRSMSAFGNTEGGITLFGAIGKANADRVEELVDLPGVSPVDAYLAKMEALLFDAVHPTLHGARAIKFEHPTHKDTGIVAIYVPLTTTGPYRAARDERVKERYFGRIGTSTGVLSHQHLAALFGRPPHARFRVGFQRRGDGRVEICLENLGPGMATMPLLRLRPKRPRPEAFGLHSETMSPWENRHSDIIHGTGEPWELAVLLPNNYRLYPRERRLIGTVLLEDMRATWHARVDCENNLPFEIEDEIVIMPHEFRWLELPAS